MTPDVEVIHMVDEHSLTLCTGEPWTSTEGEGPWELCTECRMEAVHVAERLAGVRAELAEEGAHAVQTLMGQLQESQSRLDQAQAERDRYRAALETARLASLTETVRALLRYVDEGGLSSGPTFDEIYRRVIRAMSQEEERG